MKRSLLVAVAILLIVTGCKASERADASYQLSGIYRCASGQSFVGETQDQTDAGRVTFGAALEARRDLFCVNEDNLNPGWASLAVSAKLYRRMSNGTVVQCGSDAAVQATSSERSVFAGASSACVSGYFFTHGFYSALGAYGYANFSSVTPDAYNS